MEKRASRNIDAYRGILLLDNIEMDDIRLIFVCVEVSTCVYPRQHKKCII